MRRLRRLIRRGGSRAFGLMRGQRGKRGRKVELLGEEEEVLVAVSVDLRRVRRSLRRLFFVVVGVWVGAWGSFRKKWIRSR